MQEDFKHGEITKIIIGAAYKVYNTLGAGFLEKVYENALAFELRRSGLAVAQQQPVSVYYEGEKVGDYLADIVVAGRVVVEVKAVASIEKAHEVQLVNYLKATGIEVGVLMNFGPEIQIKRKVFTRR